jgi:hypothetical protein
MFNKVGFEPGKDTEVEMMMSEYRDSVAEKE